MTEPPAESAAASEAPAAETPVAETPDAEAPAAEAPDAEAPDAEAPAAEAPAAEAPDAEAPAAEAPVAEAPEAQPGEGEPVAAQSAAAAENALSDARPRPKVGGQPELRHKPQTLDAPPVPKGPVKPPSPRDRLSPELEAQVNASLEGATLEDIMAASAGAEDLESGTRLEGTVERLHADNVFVSLGGRNQGVVSLRQFKTPPEAGQKLTVVVNSLNAEDGLYELSVPGGAVDVEDWSDLNEGAVVEARITGTNTGGLECKVNNIRGFIPASQIELYRVDNLNDYLEKKLPCVVTEVNRRKKNLVLSHRAVLEREREQERKELLASLEVGQEREGTVRSLQKFGAFVDLGGIDGLIHISQLSWDRVNDPGDVLEVGQQVKVRIEKIDPQSGKIGLSYRDLLDHPWEGIEEKFPVNSVVSGTVSRIAKFGAFVKLSPGVEGLIHISELAHHRVAQVSNVVKEGQEVQAKILNVQPDEQRIALSLKAMVEPPPVEEAEPEVEEPAREPVVKKQRGPLKGGFDRPTGGDQFGLKW